jgi:predicted RND superfamily exporter protein
MHFGEKVVKYRHAILVIAILLLIPSIMGYRATKINYDMLTYLPDDIDTMKGEKLLEKDFGKAGFSIVVVENMKSDDISDMKKDIEDVKHVDSVVNLEDVIDPNIPKDMYPSEISNLIGKNNATMLVVFFNTSTSDERTLDAVKQIRQIGTKDCYVSGLSSLVLDLKTLCEQEEAKYVAVAVVLSLAAMMLLLDSFAAPVLFLISIGMAIMYNLGTNVFFGEISYITKAIAAVLQLGVTMDYSIFLWHSYMEKLDTGMENHKAMAEAIDATLVSVTGSSVTTIAGFLALCFMTYTMGRDLGLVMAKGVLFGVICSVTVLPVLLLRFSKTLYRTRHKSLIPDTKGMARRLTSKYGIYIMIFCVALVPALYGYAHRNITYDFSKMMTSGGNNLSSSSTQFLTANKKLKEDFGINTSYIIIADSDIPEKDGRAMTDQIKDLKGIQSVLGLDSVLGTSVPKSAIPEELHDALVSKGHQMILVNSAYSVSTPQVNKQINQVKKITKTYDKGATVIGEAPATKDLISMTDRDFKVVSWVSIAMVFFIIFFVLGSWSLPFILVATIEFAIYVNLGLTGYTGLEMSFLIPVCISTIQLGSTVDYAILMSTRYKQERMSGKAKRDAIMTASAASTPSILVSALGFFAATFGVAMYSDIEVISTLCMLMARGAIISMLTVIFILPSFLMAFDHIICRTTKGMKHLYDKKPEPAAE